MNSVKVREVNRDVAVVVAQPLECSAQKIIGVIYELHYKTFLYLLLESLLFFRINGVEDKVIDIDANIDRLTMGRSSWCLGEVCGDAGWINRIFLGVDDTIK